CATRYSPLHITALFLGAFSPPDDGDFLYAPNEAFGGEAGLLLNALGISVAGKTGEAVRAEFQRAGFFLAHVLECPVSKDAGGLLTNWLQPMATRIRRSLKPK